MFDAYALVMEHVEFPVLIAFSDFSEPWQELRQAAESEDLGGVKVAQAKICKLGRCG